MMPFLIFTPSIFAALCIVAAIVCNPAYAIALPVFVAVTVMAVRWDQHESEPHRLNELPPVFAGESNLGLHRNFQGAAFVREA